MATKMLQTSELTSVENLNSGEKFRIRLFVKSSKKQDGDMYSTIEFKGSTKLEKSTIQAMKDKMGDIHLRTAFTVNGETVEFPLNSVTVEVYRSVSNGKLSFTYIKKETKDSNLQTAYDVLSVGDIKRDIVDNKMLDEEKKKKALLKLQVSDNGSTYEDWKGETKRKTITQLNNLFKIK